jgi:hypothetical protein
MICFAKLGLTQSSTYICIAKMRVYNNMLYVRYVYLTKAKLVHERKPHPVVREDAR